MRIKALLTAILLLPALLRAEDGRGLWLPEEDIRSSLLFLVDSTGRAGSVKFPEGYEITLIHEIARSELRWDERLGAVWITTSESSDIQKYVSKADLKSLGPEDFLIRSTGEEIMVVGGSDIGALYGAYHLQRLSRTGAPLTDLDIRQSPYYDMRILNHWDNLDGTVERGYAGRSIWWQPGISDWEHQALWRQYARANASVGINGTVLNNVNATPEILTRPYLEKVQTIANTLRPYGIRVYLSVNFSSPAMLGGLETSDPLNPQVAQWWKEKADEIYALIPDFGGFLVKANSEGLPGPQDFGRTHAQGANMLADALKPHGGIVMWRAFVYNPTGTDRAMQACNEFKPLDGQFRDNVIVQIKNGPVDFQPREPFSPLFGAMERTALMPEFQITQEYLGFSNHLVYLAPLFKECLDSDTYQNGPGSTVAKITGGQVFPRPVTAIAGVANIGLDANWCGHSFAQANWYAFGRLAWDPGMDEEQLAREWLGQTFTTDPAFVAPVSRMMMESREAAVDYMMPLGLHHIFAWDHHYGPEPWCEIPGAREDWLPKYYHKADSSGLGFDRTLAGSKAVAQYNPPLDSIFNSITACPENLILWFHHVPWDHRMKSGRTMWDELCFKYDTGVKTVREFQRVWENQKEAVDSERFEEVRAKLAIQAADAVWWKDACLLYFQTFSKRPFPQGVEPAVHTLDELKKIKLDLKHHN